MPTNTPAGHVAAAALLLSVLTSPLQAQVAKTPAPAAYPAVDARMSQVPDSSARTAAGLARFINSSFSTETDKARAAFAWIGNNIRYDVDKKFVVVFTRNPSELVRETLTKRAGVCRNYAELYSAIANQAGVKTYVVSGYAKSRAGALATTVGHAWCASRLDGKWYLIDPTWGAGFVQDGKFVARLNDEFFKAPPAAFISRHMPFDPLWQLLPQPRTAQQFEQGTAAPASGRRYAVADSVAAFLRLSPQQQLHATNRRIAQAGPKNNLALNYLSDSQQLEESYYLTAFKEAQAACNAGITKLNAFVSLYNRQFMPKKSDAELAQLLLAVAADFTRARQLLATVHLTSPANMASVKQFQQVLDGAEAKLRTRQSFMERYLKTEPAQRPMLFLGTGRLSRSAAPGQS